MPFYASTLEGACCRLHNPTAETIYAASSPHENQTLGKFPREGIQLVCITSAMYRGYNVGVDLAHSILLYL